MAESELTFVTFQCPIEVDDKLRAIAANLRMSRSNLIRTAIDEYLAKNMELPHPEGAVVVPLVLIAKEQPA